MYRESETLEKKSSFAAFIEIAAGLNVSSKTIERWIKKLKEQGEIVFTGPRKSGGYFVS